jgi:enediyne biosynthesis protein E4
LLYNKSRPGKIEFAPVIQGRTGDVPKSKRVGADSFKGMGVDFADFNHDGLYDMFVSNITTTYGIQESSLHFMNTAKDQADLRSRFQNGEAPFVDRSTDNLTAWGGWNWDVKMNDFNNSGDVAIVQTSGFVKGEINRWAQLQELATTNDLLLADPDWWPHVVAGDDIGGSQKLNFFVKGADGKYANISPQLGLDVPVPTRGIAIGDADGDGRLDFAVARQWEQPVFYQNVAPNAGDFIGFRLFDDVAKTEGSFPAAGSPAVGAQVTVTTQDGRKFISRVDGGSGHSGKRSNEVHIGLGNVSGPLNVHLQWRDNSGQLHQQDIQTTTGWHTFQLGSQAKER